MLIYLIDGFNLLHKIPAIRDSLSPHQDLIQFIRQNRLTGSRNNRVVIAFDGHDNGAVWEKEFRIFFSGNRIADDIIKEEITKLKNKSQVVVVSDDREVKSYAKFEGAQTLGTREFIKHKDRVHATDEKNISCSEAIEINEELEKVWLVEN